MRSRTIAGICLMIASLAPLVASGFLINAGMDNEKIVARRVAAEDKGCLDRLRKLGNVKTDKSGVATLTIKSVKDPRTAINDASSAVFVCPQRTMTDFCLGDTCLPGQTIDLTMKLRKRT